MNKQTATIILAFITIVVVVAAMTPLIPVKEQRFSELGILGPDQTIKGYPTSVAANQSFLLYGYIGNQEGNIEDYQLLVKIGDQETTVTNTTFANAPIIATYWPILRNSETWLFPMNLSVNHTRTNTSILFEPWSYNVPISAFEDTGLSHQLFLIATS